MNVIKGIMCLDALQLERADKACLEGQVTNGAEGFWLAENHSYPGS